jgi:hypothetical protein
MQNCLIKMPRDSANGVISQLSSLWGHNRIVRKLIMEEDGRSILISFSCLYCSLCALVIRVPGYRSRGSGFDSRRYQIFWEVVSLGRGPLSLVSTIEELLERKSSGSCLENWEHVPKDPSRWPRGTLYPQMLALTSLTSRGRSVGIVRSQTQATEFVLF